MPFKLKHTTLFSSTTTKMCDTYWASSVFGGRFVPIGVCDLAQVSVVPKVLV